MSSLFNVLIGSEGILDFWVVDDSLKVTDYIGNLGADPGIDGERHGSQYETSENNVSQGDTLADQVCVSFEVGVKGV